MLLLLLVMSVTAMGQTAVKPAGSGTKADPYQISSAENLLWYSNQTYNRRYFTAHLVLTQDIDMSSVCHPADEENGIEEVSFIGIGEVYFADATNFDYAFQGVFDGQGHIIRNLYQLGLGLFFSAFNATIKNVHLENIYIHQKTGLLPVGGLVGYARSSNVEDCSVSGVVLSDVRRPLGGIAGICINSKIKGCTNNTNVTSTVIRSTLPSIRDYEVGTGGIVGYSNTRVERCQNNGNITGNYYVGGIVGYGDYNNSCLSCINNGMVKASGDYVGGISGNRACSDCLNTGMVVGQKYVAGISATSSASISNCLNMGDIAVNSDGYYGLIGCYNLDIIKNCFYSTNSIITKNSQVVPSCATVRNTSFDASVSSAQLKSGETTYFLQQNRDTVFWKQNLGVDKLPQVNLDYENRDYMVVTNDVIDCRGVSVSTGSFQNGDSYDVKQLPHTYNDDYCTTCHKFVEPEFVDGVYRIKSSGNLWWFKDAVNRNALELKTQNAELAANIDLAFLCENVEPWTAIGNGTNMYMGMFDGKGFAIRNLTYNNSKDTNHNGGLFGALYNATIKNLKVMGNSTCLAGGLLAYSANKSTLEKCYVKGSITCSAEGAGGMIGFSNLSEYNYCVSYVDATGTSSVGGLIGKVNTSTDGNELFYCASYGTLTGTSNVGGLIGAMNEDVITNSVCYAPHASDFEGCYYKGDGTKVSQTKQQMNSGATLEAMADNNWFQEPTDVAPVLGNIEGFKHYQVNCLGHEIIDPLLAYFTRDDSEVRYYDSEGHHYYVDGFCECTRTPQGYIHHYVNCQGNEYVGDFALYYTDNKVEEPRLYNGDGHYYVDGFCVCSRTPEGYIHHYVDCQGNEYVGDFALYYTDNKEEDPRLYNGDGHYGDENGYCMRCHTPMSPEIDEQGRMLIANLGNLLWFRDYVNKSYPQGYNVLQTADIDLSSVCHPASETQPAANWKPILNPGVYGTYDGGGHTITGLYINDPAGADAPYASFFGFVGYNGAYFADGKITRIKNLTIEGDITSGIDCAIFGGGGQLAFFENCTSRGTINYNAITPQSNVAGILGKGKNCTFTDCHNEASITAVSQEQTYNYYAGVAIQGIFERCTNTGDITITAGYAGGITCGTVSGNPDGTAAEFCIKNCSNTGNITAICDTEHGVGYAAAITGRLTSETPIVNCWYSCNLIQDATAIPAQNKIIYGALYGPKSNMDLTPVVTNCYYNNNKQVATSSVATGYTSIHFRNGHVAALLGEPWGQNIDMDSSSPRDEFPVLGSYPVYMLSNTRFSNFSPFDLNKDGHISVADLTKKVDADKKAGIKEVTNELRTIIDLILEK